MPLLFFIPVRGAPVSADANGYLQHFEVTLEQLDKVLAAAMSKGADYADMYFEHTITHSTSLQDKKVNSAYSDVTFGVGIRVLKGDQTGYAYAENTTLESMLSAARTAANIADSNATFKTPSFGNYVPSSYYKINTPWEEVQINQKIPFITSLNDKIFAGDTRVTKVRVSHQDSTSYILFCNTEGVLSWDYRPMAYLYASCIMEENGRIENSNVYQSYRKGLEFLNDGMVDQLAKQAIEKNLAPV